MSTQRGKYTLRARAEQQAATRRRIVAATSKLHAEVGPARTTVAEIARLAGVQRLTVYNNFPDEMELFKASGEHWLAQNPPPDAAAMLAIGDPAERLRAVLGAFYGWYRKTGRATENMQRDRLVMPALDAVMRIWMDQQLSNLADAMTADFAPPARTAKRVRAAVALAFDFWTWRRLSQEGLSDSDAADLMLESVSAAK